ncbi:type-F conjugative transfer system protein TraW [Rickettsiales bacterium]|nr:type-F conjugative transfer system protein TraW [Rickettsiales bacterium]
MLLHLFRIFQIFILVILPNVTFAKDFGSVVNSYDISEKDALEMIKDKLSQMQESGKIKELQKKWQENSIKSANRPKDATNIIKKREKTFIRYYDPSITVTQDIKDHNGVIFAKKGTNINPFDKLPFNYQPIMIFIDGDDKDQINYAINLHEQNNQLKIILIRGNIINLIKDKKIRIFFDQNGSLTDKFNLQYFPSLITREGKLLKITELAL